MTSTRPVAALDNRLYICTHDNRSEGVSRGRASKDHCDLIGSKLNDVFFPNTLKNIPILSILCNQPCKVSFILDTTFFLFLVHRTRM